MICQFKDELILSCTDEKGKDADVVARDVYTTFWGEVLDCAAEGA